MSATAARRNLKSMSDMAELRNTMETSSEPPASRVYKCSPADVCMSRVHLPDGGYQAID